MRNGQNKRMRGRNRNNKSHNPLTKVYESNGPDVKIRGTASHVAEKYIQLARDAQSSGDPVGAENYYQHAEHYFRLIAAAQEQFRQNQPFYGNRPEGNDMREGAMGNDSRDAVYDDEGDDEIAMGEQPAFGTRDPQPYVPREASFYANGEQPAPQPRNNGNGAPHGEESVDRLPSFITGGGQPQQGAPGGPEASGNGERFQGGERNDRFGYRRRRHRRGPRPDAPAGNAMAEGGGDDTAN